MEELEDKRPVTCVMLSFEMTAVVSMEERLTPAVWRDSRVETIWEELMVLNMDAIVSVDRPLAREARALDIIRWSRRGLGLQRETR